jgi:hypothetical protein
MPDEMFFTSGDRALRRGKRREKRTETCRPCVIQTRDGVTHQVEGVVLDMNAYGLRVRALDAVPVGTRVSVQLMRDDSFEEPISRPLEGAVVRRESADGFADLGIRLHERRIARPEPRPAFERTPRPAQDRPAVRRMHTIDFTVGDEGLGTRRR